MTVAWWISFAAFALAFKVFGGPRNTGFDFKVAYMCFAAIGLVAMGLDYLSPLHTFWYLPVAVLASALYKNRRLLILKHRLDSIQFYDVEDLRQKIEKEVERYNSKVPEEERLK